MLGQAMLCCQFLQLVSIDLAIDAAFDLDLEHLSFDVLCAFQVFWNRKLFDQLIFENIKGAQWVHVAFKRAEPRLQVLTINEQGTFVGVVA